MPNWKKLIVSGSDATLNSLNVNTNVLADSISANTITANTFNSRIVSSSIIFTSGSNIIGDELIDIHQITGSVLVTGSLELNGTPILPIEQYTYKQDISGSDTYNISHNLNEDYPIVQIYGADKKQVIPADITSSNSNQVQIEFNTVFNGTVVVKK